MSTFFCHYCRRYMVGWLFVCPECGERHEWESER